MQCGQGNTNDVLRPTAVASLSGTCIEALAAGLWHTMCVSADGRVHVFGGNQFGPLGLGTITDQAEVSDLLPASLRFCWSHAVEQLSLFG